MHHSKRGRFLMKKKILATIIMLSFLFVSLISCGEKKKVYLKLKNNVNFYVFKKRKTKLTKKKQLNIFRIKQNKKSN